jgi:MFS family permease
MAQEIRKTEIRAVQYFFVDGSFEFGFGLLCLILAAFLFLETRVHGWLSALVDASLVLVLIGGAWLINRLIRLLKERLTWRRTGYVTYPPKAGRKRGWRLLSGSVIGGLVGGVTVVLVTNPTIRIAVMPLISGLLLGVVMVVMGWRTELGRFYLLAGASIVIGVILAFGGLENITAVCAYYLFFGIVLFITGILILRDYLRRNPAAEDQQTL